MARYGHVEAGADRLAGAATIAKGRCTITGRPVPLIAVVTGHSPESVDEILSLDVVRTRAQAALAFQKRLAPEGNGYAQDKEQQG